MILHIVNKSPFENPTLSRCLRVLSTNDSLLLIEDGVFALQNIEQWHLPDSLPLYYLSSDTEARGISNISNTSSTGISYADFVQLAVKHDKSISWF